jgi:peptidoglycan hydrolase-like protein with peptidoglycan-binding domain
MKIAMSSGHSKYLPGAIGPEPWGLHEHTENVRVVDQTAIELRKLGVEVVTYEDTVSKSVSDNLDRLVDWHNQQTRDADISVHFNASEPTQGARGHECWYASDSGKKIANAIVGPVCIASGLKNRGVKWTDDLAFLNGTAMPACLIEVAFTDAREDCDIYRARFGAICSAIAGALAGEQPSPGPEPEPEPPPSPELYPTLGRGDVGPWVRYMQLLLGTTATDGDFGPNTEEAVETFQGNEGLYIDGVCGPDTWGALRQQGPPEPPPDAFTTKQEHDITQIAARSKIADYSWEGQGVAPAGYTQGMALAYAQVYRKLKDGDSAAEEMAKAKTDNQKDVLCYYAGIFKTAGMDNSKPGADTLRHLWSLMLGHGMLESSGQHCCGRDQSASNTDSNTCEAGLFQTSYNAHSCSSQFDKVMGEYQANDWSGYLTTFEDGVSCSSADWECYGSGTGYTFQEMCKNLPAFSAETAAITLRNLCNHYGPINRYEAELRTDADAMFKAVQDYVDQIEMVS